MNPSPRWSRASAIAWLVVACVGVVASACGTTEVGQAVPSINPQPTPKSILEYQTEGINPIVAQSHGGIIGAITRVSEPKWNSVTGEPFDEFGTNPPLLPGQYRYATVRVERVLWDSPQAHGARPFGPRALRVRPGDELEVFTWGDGTMTGGIVVEGAIHENSISGPVEENQRVLWILEWNEAHFRDGDEIKVLPVLGLANDFQGNWSLRDDQAASVMAGRTVPADALIERLLAERAAGPRENRQRVGISNPLE